MNLSIRPASRVGGDFCVPGNKSISHRALIFGALANGTTRIDGFLRADDTLATMRCLRQMGVSIRDENDSVFVEGIGFEGLRAPDSVLDCGNSGTTMRLMMGVLAACPFETTLAGDESLSRRPMDRVAIPLRRMGAKVEGQGERCLPPLSTHGGELKGITYEMPVASGQVKSAILLAGLQAKGTTTVTEPVATRDHTERMLRAMGVAVESDGLRISLDASVQPRAIEIQVPGDISSAAFFLVAACLRPDWEVTARNIGVNPTRDGVLDVLRDMGAHVSLSNEKVSGGEEIADICVRGGELKATRIGGDLIPRLIDELPVLALLATQAYGTSTIRDAGEMRVKESDRIEVITRELRKLGAQIEEQPDGMTINGPTPLAGTTVTSPSGDHRIAMTLAIAGLIAEGETIVENAQAITSSFPDFKQVLEQIQQQ